MEGSHIVCVDPDEVAISQRSANSVSFSKSQLSLVIRVIVLCASEVVDLTYGL